ncbi:hypothetical protein M422DRAFT_239712 [Sphaerobolus stellatus SS14]|nr:hypothetical protein M422DRAFT_239712 [Sphaerobolus stellatus SS14]
MPIEWTKESQKMFLWGYLINEEFFKCWPERLTLWGIPGQPRWPDKADRPTTEEAVGWWDKVDDLSKEEREKVEDAEHQCRAQIAVWFNNHCTHAPEIENATKRRVNK